MTFAWYGFQLEHPEDWAPALVSGNRSEGYVRIAAPDVLSFQIRWKAFRKGADLKRSLDEYLDKLSRDARKLKTRFSSQSERVDVDWQYRWSGAGNGKGILKTVEGRTYFLEASAASNKSVQPHFQRLVNGFQVQTGPLETWSVFGLSVKLRSSLSLERHTFQSGRTRLEWRDQVGRVVTERWGFGEQILAKHNLVDWSKSALAMETAKVREVPQGLELTLERPWLKTYGLAKYEVATNQLLTIKTTSRSKKERPSWDWLI